MNIRQDSPVSQAPPLEAPPIPELAGSGPPGAGAGAGTAAGPGPKSAPMLTAPWRVRRMRHTATALGLAAVVLGALELFGAPLGIARHLRAQYLAPLDLGTAAAIVLSGLTVTAASIGEDARRLPARWLRGGALAVMALGVLGLLSLVVGTDAPLPAGASVLRLARQGFGAAFRFTTVIQALCFFALGAALWTLDREPAAERERARRPHVAEWLACGAGWVGSLAAAVSLINAPACLLMSRGIAVSSYTALAFIAIAIAVVCARPERGLAAVAVSSTSGGLLLRYLAPVTMVVPIVTMLCMVELPPHTATDGFPFGPRLGVSLASILGALGMVALEVRLALRLATEDAEQRESQNALRRALGELALALRERDRVQRDYERSNRDLDEFAYAASHDLRAPLRGISNLATWLEEDLGPSVNAVARQQFELLRGRVHRMESLIDGILQYSRAGRVQEPLVPVAVADLVNETVEMIAPPPRAQIVLTGPMPRLETERSQLQQVLLCLISNAIKHARRPDPRVEISAEDLGDHVRLVVADNGPGIAPQYHERIWEMFQQLASRDQVEGTGIGLTTVKKLVERRGGRAFVESEEGHGARFIVLWPRLSAAR